MVKVFLIILFLTASILNLIGEITHISPLILYTKVSLMPLLLFIYLSYRKKQINIYIVLGLVGGFLGDVFLTGKSDIFFMLGLTAFLAEHIFYLIAFIKTIPSIQKIPYKLYLWLIPYTIYGLKVFSFIKPQLGSLKIPVIIYMVVIIIMSFVSLLRYPFYQGKAFWLPFLGTVFFLISDSLLAIIKFKTAIYLGGFFCVLIYLLAQVLIVAGFLIKKEIKG